MIERQETYMGGNPITLLGPKPDIGKAAPDFSVLDIDLLPKHLDDYTGKIKIISVIPSIDTGVCSVQTRKFNEFAAGLDDSVVVLTISMDLPFAQKRWCGAEGVDRVQVLSDHREASFGENYGVLIKELRLLNRAVFIIDKTDTLRYIEIVRENHDHPDYERALEALKNMKE
jgi:thiol peroxidase